MSTITFGDLTTPTDSLASRGIGSGVVPQPGMTINYKSDGAVEGQVKFRCDVSDRAGLPGIGALHPLDQSAVCHDVSIEFIGNRLVEATCSYHGISKEEGESTRPILEYPGSCDQLPIQLHPRFTPWLAGTPENPAHGARWVDPETRKVSTAANAEFEGFFDPVKFPRHFGIETFFQSRPIINRSYWSRNPPVLQKSCTIFETIPGMKNPPGIVNWLLLDTPYQQVGENSWKITEQYKGSPAPGWFEEIYRKA